MDVCAPLLATMIPLSIERGWSSDALYTPSIQVNAFYRLSWFEPSTGPILESAREDVMYVCI